MTEMEPILRAEAVRINNLMRVQKMTVTKNVTKCWIYSKNLVPRIQNSHFWLTSDHITTPNLYLSPIFFPSSPHFHSLHVTRIFSVKRPKIYFDLFHSSQVGPYLRTWVLKTDLLVVLGPYQVCFLYKKSKSNHNGGGAT